MLVENCYFSISCNRKTVSYDDIYTEGITNISKTDMDYVKKMGCSIKLLATADFENGKVWARVAPAIVNKENPLSMVNDVFNAILLQVICLAMLCSMVRVLVSSYC